jgi:hypothetical protein
MRVLAAAAKSPVTQGFLRGTFSGPPGFTFDFLEVWIRQDRLTLYSPKARVRLLFWLILCEEGL